RIYTVDPRRGSTGMLQASFTPGQTENSSYRKLHTGLTGQKRQLRHPPGFKAFINRQKCIIISRLQTEVENLESPGAQHGQLFCVLGCQTVGRSVGSDPLQPRKRCCQRIKNDAKVIERINQSIAISQKHPIDTVAIACRNLGYFLQYLLRRTDMKGLPLVHPAKSALI